MSGNPFCGYSLEMSLRFGRDRRYAHFGVAVVDQRVEQVIRLTGAGEAHAREALRRSRGDVPMAIKTVLHGPAPTPAEPQPLALQASTKDQRASSGSEGLWSTIIGILGATVVMVWLGGGFESPESREVEAVAAQEWSPHVVAAAQKYAFVSSSEDVEGLPDEEIAAQLRACRSLIGQALQEEYVSGVQFPDSNWDGSLGAQAHLSAPGAMLSVSERIERYRETGVLEEEWLVFGLRDGFSGVRQVFEVASCAPLYDSVRVEACPPDSRICTGLNIPVRSK